MMERRNQKKLDKAAKKRAKGGEGVEVKATGNKRRKTNQIVPQRLENSTINSKLNTITGTGSKINVNTFRF